MILRTINNESGRLAAPMKGFLILLTLAGIIFGVRQLANHPEIASSLAPQQKAAGDIAKGTFNFSGKKSANAKKGSIENPINVGVVTWGGYAGGQYFNKGFKASNESRFMKDYGIAVNFIVIDDYTPSRDAFKADSVDLLWSTVDSFPTEVTGLKDFEPKIVFQADWSRGGDAAVVRQGIESVADLKGKKIAFAQGTPSETFLLWLLNTNDMQYSDIEAVPVDSAVTAASDFKAGKVDAAIVWSPDDSDCVKQVQGSRIFASTKQATNIIADVFYAKNSFIQANGDALQKLVEGWLIGAAEINSSEQAKHEAARILAIGLNQPEDWSLNAINNARLATLGDNVNFFNLQHNYTGVTGEEIYTAMGTAYNKINLAPATIPSWRTVAYTDAVANTHLDGAANLAENSIKFTPPTAEAKTAKAFSTKRVTINFATGSANLDANSKYAIQSKFVEIAKQSRTTRIRIEGNTDAVGSEPINQSLSLKRAQAVANFLVKEYHFDKYRFIVQGNGSANPVADNESPTGRAQNRRTDFELLTNKE